MQFLFRCHIIDNVTTHPRRALTMKALFNAECEGCDEFRPRCAEVILKLLSESPHKETFTLCEHCRRGAWKGKFTLSARHTGKEADRGEK